MVEPILAAQNAWWTSTNSAVTRADITEIEINDSYTPDASITVTDSWDASAAKDGSVMCYVVGTKLIIAGNGSGCVYLNENSSRCFGDWPAYLGGEGNSFGNVLTFSGMHILDASKCNNMNSMFYDMKKVTSLGVRTWDVSNVLNMANMFTNCSALQDIDVSLWDTGSVTNASGMFGQCYALVNIDVSNWDTSKMTNLPSFGNCTSLKNIDVSKWNTSNVTNFSSIFTACPIESINISTWDMSKATNTKYMFERCSELKSITFPSNFDFTKVQSALSMFDECTLLSDLDVSNWNPSSCTDMSFMFYSCSSLGEIDVSNWDVSKVTNFDHFAAHANLKRNGIENWKTTSAINMNALFHNCAEEELDLSDWDVSKVQFFCQMFENSPNLKRIKGLEKWDTSAGLGFDGMFERCSKLEELDLSSFNTTKAKNGTSASTNGHKTATLSNMFLSCNNLKKVMVGPNFAVNGNGSNTTTANKAVLPTPSTDYIEGADGMWYTFIGDSFAPNAMKDKTAETYYASPVMVYDADVIVKNGSLIDAAKAIREKNGAAAHYTPAQFGAAIRAL